MEYRQEHIQRFNRVEQQRKRQKDAHIQKIWIKKHLQSIAADRIGGGALGSWEHLIGQKQAEVKVMS